ncbi:MAG: NUDIX hydrolase [Chloroflexi bacterium]|nr:NUDIX hydrolase [Chloroflexota bacterium]
MSQVGLEHAQNGFESERYTRLRELSAEIVSKQSTLSQEEVQESFAMQSGYITPKVDVRAALFRDGKILLVKEVNDGRWSMPGGWADVGDTPSEAILREVKEESGFDARVLNVVGIYDANRVPNKEWMPFYHAYKLLFLCEILGGEIRTSHETPDVGFFGIDEIPPLSLFRTTMKHIEDAFAQKENPSRRTVIE